MSFLGEICRNAFGKELRELMQGDTHTGEKKPNTIYFMTESKVGAIPKDRSITYVRVVVDFRPQKADPCWARIMHCGNLIDYPGDVTTRTVDLTMTKKYEIVCFLPLAQDI